MKKGKTMEKKRVGYRIIIGLLIAISLLIPNNYEVKAVLNPYVVFKSPTDGAEYTQGEKATIEFYMLSGGYKNERYSIQVTDPSGKVVYENTKPQTNRNLRTTNCFDFPFYEYVDTTNLAAGKYTVYCRAQMYADYEWRDTSDEGQTWYFTVKEKPIEIKDNTLTVKGKTVKVKYKKIKKKAQNIGISKAISIKNAQGKISFIKKSGNKKIKINKSTGKITIKKGLKKGTYKVKVKVSASGNTKYRAITKQVIFKIKVK